MTRRALQSCVVIFLASICAGAANAVRIEFTGSLTIEIEDLGFHLCGECGYAPAGPGVMVIPGSGTAELSSSGGADASRRMAVDAGAFGATSPVLLVTDPMAQPIHGIHLTARNAAASFADGEGAGFGGRMPLAGTARLCLFNPCSAAVANLAIPLSPVGDGGSAFFTGAANLTVLGAPWTTRTQAIGTVTAMGEISVLSNASGPAGQLVLVTPVFISTSLPQRPVWGPVFGILRLDLTPEPGTLGLDAAVLGSLVGLGFTRARRRGFRDSGTRGRR